MSNWFGTQKEAAGPRRIRQGTIQEIDDLHRYFRNLTINDSRTPTVPSSYTAGVYSTATTNQATRRHLIQNPLKKITPITPGNTSFMMDSIRSKAIALDWYNISCDCRQVHFIPLSAYTTEYERIEQLFRSTNKKCFQITDIERIQNPYLLAAFLLKKEQMSKRIGSVQIKELFHGTKAACVESICNDNFDWRRYGENIGNKFGQGISFSPKSSYATHYADDVMDGRIMLLTYVLIGNEVIGTKDMKLPPKGTDTSMEPHRKVIVKYEDNEFYPAYKITYKCTSAQELQRRRVRNKRFKQRQARRANLQASAMCYSYEDYYDD